MSTVLKPATQIVETAENKASAKFVASPVAEAKGCESKIVKTAMRVAKTIRAKREGEREAKVSIDSRMSEEMDIRRASAIQPPSLGSII
jgi:hypothetical protein